MVAEEKVTSRERNIIKYISIALFGPVWLVPSTLFVQKDHVDSHAQLSNLDDRE